VAERLPAEEALAIARGIDDAWRRAEVLAAVAERLPAEEQRSVLGEALDAARRIDDAGVRAEALAAVAGQRFGITKEWCTSEVSAELRDKLRLDDPETSSAFGTLAR
jgi:hypothetical protein